LLGKSISYLLGSGKVLNLESPPFHHIILDKEILNIDMFGFVVVLHSAGNNEGSVIITP